MFAHETKNCVQLHSPLNKLGWHQLPLKYFFFFYIQLELHSLPSSLDLDKKKNDEKYSLPLSDFRVIATTDILPSPLSPFLARSLLAASIAPL